MGVKSTLGVCTRPPHTALLELHPLLRFCAYLNMCYCVVYNGTCVCIVYLCERERERGGGRDGVGGKLGGSFFGWLSTILDYECNEDTICAYQFTLALLSLSLSTDHQLC